jgi:hypothetical protein
MDGTRRPYRLNEPTPKTSDDAVRTAKISNALGQDAGLPLGSHTGTGMNAPGFSGDTILSRVWCHEKTKQTLT